MKTFGRILFITLFALAVLVMAKNVIAKAVIENGVRLATGLPLSIEKFKFSLHRGNVRIEGFELHNPAGYEEKVMVSIPKIFVDIKPLALLKGKVHIQDLQLHLKEFNAVKNKQGQLNLDTLKAVANSKKGAPAESAPSDRPAEQAKAPKIQIDHLALQIEKVSYKDYSGEKPSVQNFNINLNEEYSNVANLNAVVSLIVVKAMMSSTLATLTNFDLGGLQGSVSSALASSAKLTTDAAAKAEGLIKDNATKVMEKVNVKDATDALEGTAKNLTGSLSDAAGSLKDKLPSLGFGSKDQAKS